MGEREGPQAQVRGRVGDAPEAVLDRVDRLVHKDLAKLKLKKKKTKEKKGKKRKGLQTGRETSC